MNASHPRRGLAAIAVATVVALGGWFALPSESDSADLTEPPPLPEVPAGARPTLVSSGPLPPASGYQPAKPVVAADHEGHVLVLGQDLKAKSWDLALWRATADGEPSQHPRPLPERSPIGVYPGDPWLETDRRGRFYAVNVVAGGTWVPLTFRRSVDAGQTWSRAVTITTLADRPVLGVSPDGRRLAVVASVSVDDRSATGQTERARRYQQPGVFVSTDRGRRWRPVAGPLARTHAIPFSVVIADSGAIAASFVAEGAGSRSVVCVLHDGGKAWTDTELVAKLQPDRNHPFNGERFPVLAAGGIGSLHAAYVTAGAKGLCVRSADGWTDWREPVSLSADDAEEVRMAAIAARGSVVHVTWMERRHQLWQNYYRGSADNGRTWSERLLLSRPSADSALVTPAGYRILGDDDQSSVTDDGTGVAHAVWVVSGKKGSDPGRVWHAEIRWPTRDRSVAVGLAPK